jgi:hypothetical protein
VLSEPIVDERVIIKGAEPHERLAVRSMFLMESLIALDNIEESSDSGAFGEREEKFKISNEDKEIYIFESPCFATRLALHLTFILINNTNKSTPYNSWNLS